MALTPQQRNELRQALELRRLALLDELEAGRDKAAGSMSAVALADEEDDRRIAMREAGLAGAEQSRDRDELEAVQQALLRLDAGGCGLCVSCGREIPWVRLATWPAATRCVACQEAFEKSGTA